MSLKPPIIILGKDDYDTFEILSGQSNNRNISLQLVLALLTAKGINGTITKGKGSHRKETMPNGAVWTIPPQWNGPIPCLYLG